jgi:DNA-binding LytR/AlgR family response regulator
MIKCAILDDELLAVSILREFISEIPELHLVKFSTNEIEVLTYLQNERVDILFLDVDMPKISGIEFIKLVKQLPSPPFFVLTTAHPQYAVLGFEHDVSDYLLKPIAFDRFYKAVQKVMLQINRSHKEDHEAKSYFFVKVDTKNKTVKINHEDILYIEGLKNFVSIYTAAERIVALLNMKDLEKLLPSSKFQRVHKSYIIPSGRIKSLEGNRIYLTGGQSVIPLGPTYRPAFVAFLNRNSIKSV